VIARYAKITMTACLGAFALLVTFNNLTDPAGNWPFVAHVLSMDTTFHDPATAWRAIHQPWLWRAGYALIILGEGMTAVLMLAAAWRMFVARRDPAATFNRAKAWLHLAALAGFLVWFTGFMTIGGEWFAMWQSTMWNGQQAAFRFYVTILLVLIYVMQPDGDVWE
jgi:predicted small integral membrane protein